MARVLIEDEMFNGYKIAKLTGSLGWRYNRNRKKLIFKARELFFEKGVPRREYAFRVIREEREMSLGIYTPEGEFISLPRVFDFAERDFYKYILFLPRLDREDAMFIRAYLDHQANAIGFSGGGDDVAAALASHVFGHLPLVPEPFEVPPSAIGSYYMYTYDLQNSISAINNYNIISKTLRGKIGASVDEALARYNRNSLYGDYVNDGLRGTIDSVMETASLSVHEATKIYNEKMRSVHRSLRIAASESKRDRDTYYPGSKLPGLTWVIVENDDGEEVGHANG